MSFWVAPHYRNAFAASTYRSRPILRTPTVEAGRFVRMSFGPWEQTAVMSDGDNWFGPVFQVSSRFEPWWKTNMYM